MSPTQQKTPCSGVNRSQYFNYSMKILKVIQFLFVLFAIIFGVFSIYLSANAYTLPGEPVSTLPFTYGGYTYTDVMYSNYLPGNSGQGDAQVTYFNSSAYTRASPGCGSYTDHSCEVEIGSLPIGSIDEAGKSQAWIAARNDASRSITFSCNATTWDCNSGSPSNNNGDFHNMYDTVDEIFTASRNVLDFFGRGQGYDSPFRPNSSTRVYLSIPENNATSTTEGIYFLKYFISTSTQPQPTNLQVIITPSRKGFFGTGSGSPVIYNLSNLLPDFLASVNFQAQLNDGTYTWQAFLQATTTGACTANAVICAWQGITGTGTTVSTTTIASSEKWSFTIGDGGLYATTTGQGNITSNPLTYCQQFQGDGSITSQIVTAICFIPNAIMYAVDLIFIPDPSDLVLNQQILNNDFNQTLTVVPWGYITRFISIVNATSTQTLPDLSINPFQLISGLPSATSTYSIPIFSWGNIMSSSTFIGSSTAFDGRSLRDIVAPAMNILLSIALGAYIFYRLLKLNHSSENKKL